ncbi:MAG: TolC family protein [Puniceicoccales bacterium]|jgi:outer membrane protein TolC|nr:TolC family protein [Puniceicoccales bacterium]
MPAQRNHLFTKVSSLIFPVIALAPLLGCSTADSGTASASTSAGTTESAEINFDKLLAPVNNETVSPSLEVDIAYGDRKLGDLLRHASMYSPEMIRQEYNIARNDAFRFRGWRQYMPFINANYQFGYYNLLKSDNTNTSGSSDKIGGSYNISARYPIFYWGAYSAEKNVAFIREQRAQGSATVAWRRLAAGIRKNYFDMVVLKNDIALHEKRIIWTQKQQDKTAAIHEAGRISQSTQSAQSLELKRLELELERKKIILQTMLGKIRSDSGLDTFSLDDIPLSIQEPNVDVKILEQQIKSFQVVGTDESIEVKMAQLYREELDEEITRVRANALPNFNLGASVSQSPYQTNTGTFGLQTIFFAGINGSWNLFDRDITNATVRSLKTQQQLIDAELKSTKTQRLINLENQIEEIRISQEMLALRLEYRNNIQAQLDAVKQQFSLGQVDQSAVDNAEENLLTVDQQILNDRINIANAYYLFQSGIEQDPAAVIYTPPSNED